jgi:hypothetical protein
VRAASPATVVVLLTIAAAVAQQPQWWELYDDALKHIQAQEWQDAEGKLLKARELGPSSGRAVLRYGSLRPPFFPEYYLGIVYQATGRPKEALQQFQLARKANLDLRSAEFRQLPIFEGMAKTALSRTPPPFVVPEKDPPRVAPRPADLPITAPPPTPDYVQQFVQLLGAGRTHLTQRNFDEAARSATAARDLAIKQTLVAERPQAEALLREIDGARYAARVEAAIGRRDVESARQELLVLTVAAPAYPADALRKRIEELSRDLQADDLQRNAMRSFFGGNYSQALSVLADLEKGPGLTARAHFYRACTLAALAAGTSTPGQDRRLAEARRSYALAAANKEQFSRDLQYISPKIRELLGIP